MITYIEFESLLKSKIANKKNLLSYWKNERKNFPEKQLIDNTLELKENEIHILENLLLDLNEDNYIEIFKIYRDILTK